MTDVIHTTTPPSLAVRVAGLTAPSAFGRVLGRPPADAISLAGGSPAVEALPSADLAAAVAEVLRDQSRAAAALDYSAQAGSPVLRRWLADREGVDADRVVITNGALHGLSLSFLATVDPGTTVVVEDPTYPLALKALQLTGADVTAIPVDGDGLRTDLLEERLRAGLRPSALYTVPDFQNPTGRTLSVERRAHLVELAETYGFVVVSDNPYAELRWQGDRPADLDASSDRVIRVNTFSKTLGPGLRLGWAVLPEWAHQGFIDLRSRSDQHPSSLTQAAVAELVTRPGFFDGVVAAATALYRHRAAVFIDALRAEFGDAIEVEVPQGGVFAWPRFLDRRADVDEITARAAAAGVLLLPGSQFAVGDAAEISRYARASFGQADDDALREGARRLAVAYREAGR